MSTTGGRRAGGPLLHLTSLPGRFGIGDLGPEAHRFVDGLAGAGQRYWQMLPIGPTGFGNSPYGVSVASEHGKLLAAVKIAGRPRGARDLLIAATARATDDRSLVSARCAIAGGD